MTDVARSGVPAGVDDRAAVIRLDLARAVDMFERPQVELGSSHGTFQPGIDRCIAELQGRPTGRPVHLELMLPESEISDGLEESLAVIRQRLTDIFTRAQAEGRTPELVAQHLACELIGRSPVKASPT
jgi:hypothetical protein